MNQARIVKKCQRGVALFIALIALVALSLAGIALVRSVDTTNVIAGNLTFRQAALHASDVGVEKALDTLGTIISSSLDANYPSGCGTACNYYPTEQATNDIGIPTVINWGTVPNAITVNSSYKVQYVIDRLCEGPAPVTDIQGKCSATEAAGGGTKKSMGTVFSGSVMVYYRVTIKVTGPRNTNSIVQVLLTR